MLHSFPDYHGPYSVGTVDVELPVADLPSAATVPSGAQPTVAFRIFYPCTPPSGRRADRSVYWVQNPQYETVRALAKFLEIRDRFASLGASLAQHLRWIKIPAHRNAPIHDPPEVNGGRWPVTFFSHGLAGSRNAYSYICGDLASFGTVVIAPDHRDGSSPIQFVRPTENSEPAVIEPRKYPHVPEAATWKGRDEQLRIRLFEMSTIFEAVVRIDAGDKLRNLDDNCSHDRQVRVEVLQQFAGILDVNEPGKVSWAGHSFGAATTVQLLKTVYYSSKRPSEFALFEPSSNACIAQQITPDSPTLLLDPWCLPFLSPDQAWIERLPLPSYEGRHSNHNNVLVVLSEGFFNWSANLEAVKHIVAPPSRDRKRPSLSPRGPTAYLPKHAYLRGESPPDSGYVSESSSTTRASRAPSQDAPHVPQPHCFYVQRSQHLNQSDFGVLFPWLTKRFAGAEEPERIMELNTRAMVQVMRNAGISMGGQDDAKILDTGASIRRWIPVPGGNQQDQCLGDHELVAHLQDNVQEVELEPGQ